MKKYIDIFFSMLTSVILLVIFAAAIGYATFAESSNGTPYAMDIIYKALWFEVLLGLLIVNMIGSILHYKLINKRKWSMLLFHVSFIFILIGSAVTRYFGSEGIMHLRQGETSSEISSQKTAVKIVAEYKGQKVEKSTLVNFSVNASNVFAENLTVGGKKVTVETELFVPNSEESIVPDESGVPAVNVFVMSGMEQSTYFTLMGNENALAGNMSFGFTNNNDSADIQFSVDSNNLYLKSTYPISKTGMVASGMIDRENAIPIAPGNLCLAEQNTVFRVEKLVFMIQGFIPKAVKMLTPINTEGTEPSMGSDALVFKISSDNASKKINVISTQNQEATPTTCDINDLKVAVSYGAYLEKLPFSITLRKFELERYSGSMSPSSYASEITVTDTEMKSVRPFRIYMNNILNYRGYRFFQSSYDQDEMGTVLSVNHDYWGTFITYIGYLLMLIGMVFTLFNKNSRFITLLNLINQIQQKRKTAKTLMLAGVLFVSGAMFAAGNVTKNEHIDALNSLLIQDAAQGRIEPFNTFASDVLRKIYKHNSYKGQSAAEVILGMSVNPPDWKNEPIIKVANPQLEKELGAVDGYVSYNALFDFKKGGEYKLQNVVAATYQKDETTRNKYEKEALNVDERINISTQLYDHSMLLLFPSAGDKDGKWTIAESSMTSMTHDGGSVCPVHGKVEVGGMGEGMEGMSGMGEGMEGMSAEAEMGGMPPAGGSGICTRDMSATGSMSNSVGMGMSEQVSLLMNYFGAASVGMSSGNWSDANEKLALIKNYQLAHGGDNLPSANKVKLEISYNNWNIFNNLALIYGLLGSLLLLLHFVYIFKAYPRLEKILDMAVYPLAILFVVFTAGLGIRWYIAEHAPWSNGYEAMIFVGWATSFAGLLFARKSPLAFATSALLSSIALATAAMSWMNPEITNLVPVLKSYWLIVHVAVITASYGFLAMGALLGFLNLALMIGKTKANNARISDNIQEICYIIEMALTVGLFMLTVGTFLGGVWANESWGRYWGWDAKETWALVSVLVYAAVLHLRLIPKTNTTFVMSVAALLSFSSIIMTFLGVNYYLSGMHSYGAGTAPALPGSLALVMVAVVAVVFFAYRNETKLKS